MARLSRSATRACAYCPASRMRWSGATAPASRLSSGILTGLREPDSGEIRFHGEPAPAIADREGWRRRVACVYQHSTIIPDLTVAENLFINRQPLRRGFINWGTLWRDAREVLDRWDVSVSERSRAGDLQGRGSAIGRDRARPFVWRAIHHSRRADGATGRRGDQAPVRANAPIAGARGDVPVHLPPPSGGLRGLSDRDRAARREAHPDRAGRDLAQGRAHRGDDRASR